MVSNGVKYTAKSLSAGDSHACVILSDDALKCWGRNTYGQLGIGDNLNRGDAKNEMGNNLPKVNLGVGKTAKFVSAGTDHTCAILNDDTLKCWGDNTYGQLGYSNTTTISSPNNAPVSFATGRSVLQVSAGIAHTCALLDDNTVRCWGKNESGQLGRENTDSLTAPAANAVQLGTGRTAVQISARGNHSCAVLDDGTVKCWGENYKGQLGQNDAKSEMSMIGVGPNQMGDYLTPIELGTGRTAIDVETSNVATAGNQSFGNTCVLLDDQNIKCWGGNSFFQLGLGVINTTSVGDAVGEIASLSAIALSSNLTVSDVSLGAAHVCAVLGDYSVKCWGWGARGQLGNGSWINRGSCCMGDVLPVANLNDPLAQTATAVVVQTSAAQTNVAALETAAVARAQTATAIAVSKAQTAAPGLTAKAVVAQTKAAAVETAAVAKAQTAAPGLTAKAVVAQTKAAALEMTAVAKAQTATAIAVSKAQTAAPGLTAKAAVAQTKAAAKTQTKQAQGNGIAQVPQMTVTQTPVVPVQRAITANEHHIMATVQARWASATQVLRHLAP
jgi:alpha-tubulin suppressor-like RCC1 family protein